MTHNPETTHPFKVIEGSVYKTDMYFVTAEVDAEQCRDLLLHNREPEKGKKGTNRKHSVTVVKKYAQQILADLWHENPQPIVFVKDRISSMGDGQQRLKAVILASKTNPDVRVKFTFCFDASPESMWVIDMGKRRVPADWLAMFGEVNAKQLSDAVRMLYALTEVPFQSIALWRKVDMPPEMQMEFLEKHPDLRGALTEARNAKSKINPYVGAVLWYLMMKEYDSFLTLDFFTGMQTGAFPSPDDPRLKAREYLSLLKQGKPPYKWDGFELLALLIATVNAWLTNQEFFQAKKAHGLAGGKVFPALVTKDKLPTTMIVRGNDPKTS